MSSKEWQRLSPTEKKLASQAYEEMIAERQARAEAVAPALAAIGINHDAAVSFLAGIPRRDGFDKDEFDKVYNKILRESNCLDDHLDPVPRIPEDKAVQLEHRERI